MKNLTVYIVFVVAVVAVGALIGVNNVPGEWYQSLQKPFFNPPNWIFGPVWTTLYVMIGVAGARTWIRKPMGTRMRLWFTQMVLNFCGRRCFSACKARRAHLSSSFRC